MKDVILKFIGTGYNGINEAYVTIYSYDKKVWEGNTFNGKIYCKLKIGSFYNLIAKTKYGIINKCFYINDNSTYIFTFHYCIKKIECPIKHLITFILTDYYYDNLPIEKGELLVG